MKNYLTIFLLVILSVGSYAHAQNSLEPHIIHTVEVEDAVAYSSTIRKEDNHLSNISSGDWFSIKTGDLGEGADTLRILYAKGDSSFANLEIRKNSLSGPIIGGGNVPNTRGWRSFKNETYLIGDLEGSSELFFIFSGDGIVGTIDHISFGRSQKNVLEAEENYASFGTDEISNVVTKVHSGDWLQFKDVILGNGFSEIALRYRKRNDLPFNVTFHLDSLDGPEIGSIYLPETTVDPIVISGALSENSGTHDIFAHFTGIGRLALIDYFSFQNQPAETQLKLSDADIIQGMSISSDSQYLRTETAEEHWFRFDRTSGSYNPIVQVKYAKDSDLPMRLEVRKNRPNGRLLGTIDLSSTGSLSDFESVSTRLNNSPHGIYNLAFSLVGEGDVHIGDINLTRFGNSKSLIENESLKPVLGETNFDNIIIDQFGYRPEMAKVAILRDGEIGLGSADANYIPGDEISLIDQRTNEIVLSGPSIAFLNGAIDPLSGDRVWTFDFSDIQTPGTYYIYDAENNARSANFVINENIYESVLREAFRTFVYQRSGFEKTADIVGENYADGASHIGPFQDSGARLFNDRRNRTTERDLSGGWYDAGDFNKYSNWTADYIIGLLHAYHANPEAWADDWNLPESGNGIPDVLDEVRWGVEHLQRMQETASETNEANIGAVLSLSLIHI